MCIIALYTSNYYDDKYFVRFSHTVKIYYHRIYTLTIIQKIYFLSSQGIRMSGNSLNFDEKKISKVTSITKIRKYSI